MLEYESGIVLVQFLIEPRANQEPSSRIEAVRKPRDKDYKDRSR